MLIILLELEILFSYGSMPDKLIIFLTNTTILKPESLVYLGTLNVIDGMITTKYREYSHLGN